MSVRTAATGAVSENRPWSALRLFNLYRTVISGLSLVVFLTTGAEVLGRLHPMLFVSVNTLYLASSFILSTLIRHRRPSLVSLTWMQAMVDILAIALLTYASGGVASGLGVLMLGAVAGASLLLPGRLALLVAALGALAILSLEGAIAFSGGAAHTYTSAGLLGAALFATALLTLTLTHRARHHEVLAIQRGLDLANLTELNKHIVNRLAFGIIVVDEAARIRLINQAAWSLLGCSPGSQTRHLADLSASLYRLFLDWLPTQALNSPTKPLSVPGATELQARIARIGQRKEDHGAIIYLNDMAELSRQFQQVKLAALGRLTASIAHEIRNPLGAISHAAQLLKESSEITPADTRLADIIHVQAKRMNTLILDMLRLSRKEAPAPSTLVLRDWLKGFVHDFGATQRLDNAWASIAVMPKTLTIFMDPNHLHQVLWNLCYNAHHHGRDAQGTLKVRLVGGIDSRTLYLEIRDTGPGVPETRQDKLFEPFFTTSAQGTGLGLYIARELLEHNGGALSYRPDPSGGCFRIEFPLSHAQVQVKDDSQGARAHR